MEQTRPATRYRWPPVPNCSNKTSPTCGTAIALHRASLWALLMPDPPLSPRPATFGACSYGMRQEKSTRRASQAGGRRACSHRTPGPPNGSATKRQRKRRCATRPRLGSQPGCKALAAEKSTEQHFAWRTIINLTQPLRFAALYATGQDTVSAWVDGTQVLLAKPLPPWQADAVEEICARRCDDATQCRRKHACRLSRCIMSSIPMAWSRRPAVDDRNAGSPVCGRQLADIREQSRLESRGSSPIQAGSRRASTTPGWKKAVALVQKPGSTDDPAGHPWIPDSVKSLRQTFDGQHAGEIRAPLRDGAGRV